MSENTGKSLNFLNLHTQAYTNIEIRIISFIVGMLILIVISP